MTSDDKFEKFLNGFKDTMKRKKKPTQTTFTSSLNTIAPIDKIGSKKRVRKENFKKF